MIKLIICLLMVNVSLASTESYIVKQGNAILSMEDIDGYALTIPKDKRAGFFNSADRIDTTIDTLLKMIIVSNNASKIKIDEGYIDDRISNYLAMNNDRLSQESISDYDFLKLKNFLRIVETYVYIKNEIENSIKEEDLIDLARESYEIDKDKYFREKELRNLQYINIKYNDENQKEQNSLANEILKKWQTGINFEDLTNLYSENNTVEFLDGIDNFYYNDKYKTFSDFVFTNKSEGIVLNVLDAKNRYIIAKINKIQPQGYMPFDEVKSEILKGLLKSKKNRAFSDYLLSISKGKIEVNEEAILSLKERYSDES